jgi:hypothetical protein
MANDPPFAALNHVVSDSKIPKSRTIGGLVLDRVIGQVDL